MELIRSRPQPQFPAALVKTVDVSAAIEQELPGSLRRVLRQLGAVADGLGLATYLVGGAVRDLLLGIGNLDLDFVVEGDAIALARALGEAWSARVRAYPRFGTAQVTLPDGLVLDFATARTETYGRPAALPEVSASPIRDDLHRRDFTINAMAVRVREDRFGELLDPYGGIHDLDDRSIRILHPASFVEDPTRILRGLRFAVRLGFRMEAWTEALALAAAEEGRLGQLTPERFRREILLGLDESDPVALARQWERFGILRFIHSGLTLHGEIMECCLRVLGWFDTLQQADSPDRAALLLAGLLSPLPPDAVGEVCTHRLRLAPVRKETILESIRLAETIAIRAPGVQPSELDELLRRHRLETLLYAVAHADADPVRVAVGSYITHLRHVRLLVSGDELKARGIAPGPAMGRALRDALAEKLDGRLPSHAAELHFIMARLGDAEERISDV